MKCKLRPKCILIYSYLIATPPQNKGTWEHQQWGRLRMHRVPDTALRVQITGPPWKRTDCYLSKLDNHIQMTQQLCS